MVLHQYWTDASTISYISLTLPVRLFFLEANCDWLIKTIREITKSNQVWTVASCRYVNHLEFALGDLDFWRKAAKVIKQKIKLDQYKRLYIQAGLCAHF